MKSNEMAAIENDQDLDRLMERYAAGEPEAFDALYSGVTPRLRRFLRRLTRDTNDVDDLLQTTFAKAHRARHRYQPGLPVLAWMQTIARRSFYDEVRSARAERERLTHDGDVPEQTTDDASARVAAAQAIDRALESLDVKQREAITLTVLLGLSTSEAADRARTSRESIKTRVHRGRRALQASGQAA